MISIILFCFPRGFFFFFFDEFVNVGISTDVLLSNVKVNANLLTRFTM